MATITVYETRRIAGCVTSITCENEEHADKLARLISKSGEYSAFIGPVGNSNIYQKGVCSPAVNL